MNTRTHALITDAVLLQILDQDFINNRLKSEIIGYRDSIRKGCVIEDYPPPRTIFHGYNPYTKLGWNVLKTTAPILAARYLKDAISAYNSNKAHAYHKLGRIIHLIEDMGTPAHVHAYPHGIRDDYESFLRNNRGIVKRILRASHSDNAAESMVFDSAQDVHVHSLFHGLAKHTYDMSSWISFDDVFVNISDLTKLLPKEIKPSKPRPAMYERVSDSWYLCGLFDGRTADICHWYALELLPLVIRYVFELVKAFWRLANQEVFVDQAQETPFSILEPGLVTI